MIYHFKVEVTSLGSVSAWILGLTGFFYESNFACGRLGTVKPVPWGIPPPPNLIDLLQLVSLPMIGYNARGGKAGE